MNLALALLVLSQTMSVESIDAGAVISGVYEGPACVDPIRVTAHNGANTFDNAFVWDVQPANQRDINTFEWRNGGVPIMGLEGTPGLVELYVFGAVGTNQFNNRTDVVSPVTFTSFLQGNSGMPAFVFDQANPRTSGQAQVVFRTGGDTSGANSCGYYPSPGFSEDSSSNPLWSCAGSVAGVGNTRRGAFVSSQTGSGSISLECENFGGSGPGCYVPVLSHMSNGSIHGAFTVINWADNEGHGSDGGLMLNLMNPGVYNYPSSGLQDSVFAVDWAGGFGNFLSGATYGPGPHQLRQCPDPNPNRNELGSGCSGGALYYASDTEHYYIAKVGDQPDGGSTGYVQMAEQPDVATLQAQLIALAARVSALEHGCYVR